MRKVAWFTFVQNFLWPSGPHGASLAGRAAVREGSTAFGLQLGWAAGSLCRGTRAPERGRRASQFCS